MQRRHILLATALLALVTAAPARADDDGPRTEVTPLFGAWLPIGGAGSDLASAPLTGLQVAAELSPHLAVVGTFAWIPTEAKSLSSTGLDMLEYDLGLRAQHAFPLGRGVTLRPNLGLGVGLRTLHVRDPAYAGGTDWGTYASAGVEAGYRALVAGVAVRHELTRGGAPELDGLYQAVSLFASAGLRF